MKIGVITFWYGYENYGMMLQCWALQEFLKAQGHHPFVIRFHAEIYKTPARKRKEALILYPILRYIYRKCIFLLHYKENKNQYSKISRRGFETFRKTHLSLSPRTYSTLQQIQKNPPQADCYIVGSDQVWSQLISNPNNRAYFLDFGKHSVKRIAYAPSFGLPDYPIELKENLRKCLSNFDAISVRENAGIDICSSLGYKVTKTLDPTLLLDKSIYLELFKDINQTESDFIFIYCLNISSPEDIRYQELKKLADTNKKNLYVTPGKGYKASTELFPKDEVNYSYDTIEEWLSHIYHSSLVVTSSFHGIVLSIILEKDFIYVPLKGEFAHTNNRVLDLLKDLELEERILNKNSTYSQIFKTSISWLSVGKKLYKLKKESTDFLFENLR